MLDPARELNDTQPDSEASTRGEVAARTAGVVELAEQITGQTVDVERLSRLLEARTNGQIAIDELYAMVALMAQQQYERLESRVSSLETSVASIDGLWESAQRFQEVTIAQRLQDAEDKAEARLRVIKEQQRALDAYRFWDWRARFRRASQPRLGILYQYDPQPVRIPVKYARTPLPPNPPSISIVTPSFKSGAFLERTLCSVLDQNYPDLELVVQDGGSTDNTAEILDSYKNRLSAAVIEPDDGQADAINRASLERPARSWHT